MTTMSPKAPRKSAVLFPALLMICLASPLAAEPAAPAGPPAPEQHPALEPFRLLDGTWTGSVTHTHNDPEGVTEDAVAVYRTTAAGTAVSETIFCDTEHEMISIIHMDGDDLVLTHYCALGNQPKLIAAKSDDPTRIQFEFVGGTNMKSHDEPHIHRAAFHFVSPDQVQSTWEMYTNGEPMGKATLTLTRQDDDAIHDLDDIVELDDEEEFEDELEED